MSFVDSEKFNIPLIPMISTKVSGKAEFNYFLIKLQAFMSLR